MDEIAHIVYSFIFYCFPSYMQDTKILEIVYIWFHPRETTFSSHFINSVP